MSSINMNNVIASYMRSEEFRQNMRSISKNSKPETHLEELRNVCDQIEDHLTAKFTRLVQDELKKDEILSIIKDKIFEYTNYFIATGIYNAFNTDITFVEMKNRLLMDLDDLCDKRKDVFILSVFGEHGAQQLIDSQLKKIDDLSNEQLINHSERFSDLLLDSSNLCNNQLSTQLSNQRKVFEGLMGLITVEANNNLMRIQNLTISNERIVQLESEVQSLRTDLKNLSDEKDRLVKGHHNDMSCVLFLVSALSLISLPAIVHGWRCLNHGSI